MNFLKNIDFKRIKPEKFIVVIEIPQGSKKKYEMDKETGLLILDRYLTTTFSYPVNYGFIPLTYCDDNDPLDVFVLSQEALDLMILVECRAIGVLRMIDDGKIDEKIIAVPIGDLHMQIYRNIQDLPISLLNEIEHFLLHYKDLENKSVVIESRGDINKALETIKNALLKYQVLFNS